MKPYFTLLAILALALGSCGKGDLDSTFVEEADIGLDASQDIGGDQAENPDLLSDAQSDAGTLDAELDIPDEPPVVCPRVRVIDSIVSLNIRPTPSTEQAPIGSLIPGFVVSALALVNGEAVEGENRWYQIESPRGNGFVHYDFVECTEDELTTMPVGYYMPYACNAQHRVTQGPGGGTSHTGNSYYAYDFSSAPGTSIRSMMAGSVSRVWMETQPGDACYNGGGSSCRNASNHIMISHPNGQTTVYKHLNSATVAVGAQVTVGQEIGKSGNTGWSTGPHLHIGVCNGATTDQFCQTVDFSFVDIGKPANVTVASGNCP